MTRPGPVFYLIFIGVLILPLQEPRAAQNESPAEIASHLDDLYRRGSSHAVMTMKVVTGKSEQKLQVESWSKGKKYTLVRALEPTQQHGTSTMKLGTSVWSYLPDVDRVIKIPSSMMSSPWMESHLTNDDAVRGSMLSDDYTAEISFSGVREGTEVIELTLTPRQAVAAVWSKVIARVRRSDWIPLKIEFYGAEAGLVRVMTFSDIRELGGRTLPARLLITPAGNPGDYTEITYEAIRFDVDINQDFFSLKSLRNPEPL